jgi:hypothetical protein
MAYSSSFDNDADFFCVGKGSTLLSAEESLSPSLDKVATFDLVANCAHDLKTVSFWALAFT